MFPFSLVRALDGYDLAGFEPSDTAGVRAAVEGLAGWLVDVPDPRRAKGRRHALVAVVCLLVVAAIAGCTTLRGSLAWSKDLTVGTVAGLGFTRGLPARSTIIALLKGLDPVVVCEAVTGRLAVRALEVTGPVQRVHCRSGRQGSSWREGRQG